VCCGCFVCAPGTTGGYGILPTGVEVDSDRERCFRGKGAFAAPASVQMHLDTMKVKLAQMEALVG
jgi:hypothetical protein